MGVSGGSGVFRRFREACSKWPLSRSTSARDGKGAVIFASTDEVLALVYRPNLTVRVSVLHSCLNVKIACCFRTNCRRFVRGLLVTTMAFY